MFLHSSSPQDAAAPISAIVEPAAARAQPRWRWRVDPRQSGAMAIVRDPDDRAVPGIPAATLSGGASGGGAIQGGSGAPGGGLGVPGAIVNQTTGAGIGVHDTL